MGSDLYMAEQESAARRLAALQASLRAFVSAGEHEDDTVPATSPEPLPNWAWTWISNALERSEFRP